MIIPRTEAATHIPPSKLPGTSFRTLNDIWGTRRKAPRPPVQRIIMWECRSDEACVKLKNLDSPPAAILSPLSDLLPNTP